VNRPHKRHQGPLRYRVDGWIRDIVMRAISGLAPRSHDKTPDLRDPSIEKILLVRANFRMGNAVLALPAVAAFRKNFPNATIDFVGSPISSLLFQGQPLNHHYIAPRRFPAVLWRYPQLLRRLRADRYDLAVDVSCSHSGVGSFIVAVSKARFRAGIAGKWDRLFNWKIAKLRAENKYLKLREFLTALGLDRVDALGSIQFTGAEKSVGSERLESLVGRNTGKAVGVFVGGRKLRGKRWPIENFTKLIQEMRRRGVRVVAFLGPEEKDIADALRASLDPSVPIVFEPSARRFAAIVAHLDLLICCDSGPMHLACATGVRVVAIFQPRDVARWAPPQAAARTVAIPDAAGTDMVLAAALEELSAQASTDAVPSPQAAIVRNRKL